MVNGIQSHQEVGSQCHLRRHWQQRHHHIHWQVLDWHSQPVQLQSTALQAGTPPPSHEKSPSTSWSRCSLMQTNCRTACPAASPQSRSSVTNTDIMQYTQMRRQDINIWTWLANMSYCASARSSKFPAVLHNILSTSTTLYVDYYTCSDICELAIIHQLYWSHLCAIILTTMTIITIIISTYITHY